MVKNRESGDDDMDNNNILQNITAVFEDIGECISNCIGTRKTLRNIGDNTLLYIEWTLPKFQICVMSKNEFLKIYEENKDMEQNIKIYIAEKECLKNIEVCFKNMIDVMYEDNKYQKNIIDEIENREETKMFLKMLEEVIDKYVRYTPGEEVYFK